MTIKITPAQLTLAQGGKTVALEGGYAFEVEDQVKTHGRWCCTLASGRTYAVVPVDGGFQRGYKFGKTIAQAMVGAQL
jgi:hypothetical protein